MNLQFDLIEVRRDSLLGIENRLQAASLPTRLGFVQVDETNVGLLIALVVSCTVYDHVHANYHLQIDVRMSYLLRRYE